MVAAEGFQAAAATAFDTRNKRPVVERLLKSIAKVLESTPPDRQAPRTRSDRRQNSPRPRTRSAAGWRASSGGYASRRRTGKRAVPATGAGRIRRRARAARGARDRRRRGKPGAAARRQGILGHGPGRRRADGLRGAGPFADSWGGSRAARDRQSLSGAGARRDPGRRANSVHDRSARPAGLDRSQGVGIAHHGAGRAGGPRYYRLPIWRRRPSWT